MMTRRAIRRIPAKTSGMAISRMRPSALQADCDESARHREPGWPSKKQCVAKVIDWQIRSPYGVDFVTVPGYLRWNAA
ncbi:MAG: hypothetical protein KDA96_22300 [Planctomycetaceae bacterium]|nr:hypothetical protein [Planctomycetaceae bacterium]